MIDRRAFLGLLAAAPALFATGSLAAPRVPFDRAAFDAAVAAGGPVLIDVFAPWCTTCRAQSAVLADLFARPEFAGFQVFVIDYDSQKDLMRSFGVQQRSTLIAFSGGVEVGRVIGDTRPAAIEALLAAAT
jgi:thiol-disulfide isomerase/thioredoxin